MGRHWILVPDLFPGTVVSFYWKDDIRAPGRSWRIRDYSSGAKVEYGPTHFDFTHQQILAQASWDKSADKVHVDDPYWVNETRLLNRQHASRLRPATQIPRSTRADATMPPSSIPVLEEQELRRRRQGKALERMLTSLKSEDWVSWTVFRLLERQPGWWPALLSTAELDGVDHQSVPAIKLWRAVPSPSAYERASRARMSTSVDAATRERAQLSKPVEGATEVDITIEGPDLLWFLEAKLHSDLSANTTYDPTRNQLARNIDVLLEQARGRRAVMSLVVLDRGAHRFHTQLVAQYRTNPRSLYEALPHRTPEELDAVLRDLRVILWRDLLPLLGEFEPASVRAELVRRVNGVHPRVG